MLGIEHCVDEIPRSRRSLLNAPDGGLRHLIVILKIGTKTGSESKLTHHPQKTSDIHRRCLYRRYSADRLSIWSPIHWHALDFS
jgi:hypothetical protein